MKEFISIDFETGNPKRVSACALGYAKVSDGKIVETNGYLIRPVGGHAPFQSKIHGIKEEHTHDKPEFGELFPQVEEIFSYPLVAHSLFDRQVLNALSEHFSLELEYEYIDSCTIAKKKLPDLKNHKLKTLVKHFQLPEFKHHDAREDAIACANIFLKLQDSVEESESGILSEEQYELRGMIKGILADDEVNYKEAYELLYWLQDHKDIANQYSDIYKVTKDALEDDYLDSIEATQIKTVLERTNRELNK